MKITADLIKKVRKVKGVESCIRVPGSMNSLGCHIGEIDNLVVEGGDFNFIDVLSLLTKGGYRLIGNHQPIKIVYPQKTNDYDWRGQR